MPIPVPGQPAPDFTVTVFTPSFTFAERKLSDYKGKYLVVFFYPMDFTFVCPSEIIAFTDAVDKFRELNCELLVGSCDSEFSHMAWSMEERKEGGIGPCKCDLFSDKSCTMAEQFGVLIPDLKRTFRALFIISDKGIVRSLIINDVHVSRSVEECFRLVQAFQHADKTGKVIPCNWKPSEPDDVIEPDPQGMKDYFKKHY